MSLRVMSYNIKGQASRFHGGHIREIARTIREAKPDLAGLQEVHRGTWRARSRDQAVELEAETGMTMVFGRSLGDHRASYGNLLLTTGAVETWHVEPLPGGGEPRSLLVATLTVSGIRLQAYVTHFAAWLQLGARKRLRQAEAVAEVTRQSEAPFVLMGDFNTTPTSAELRVFRDDRFVSSCFARDVITHRATRKCLDYIFVGPGWQIHNAAVLEHGPSDHWPLIADIERARGIRPGQPPI